MYSFNAKKISNYIHKKDIEDVKKFLTDFSRNKAIYEKLQSIRHSEKILSGYGIEGWMQIEMSLFLEKSIISYFKKWQREENIKVANHIEKQVVRPDFIFVPNSRRQANKIIFELKTNLNDPWKCIKKTLNDLEKYNTAESESFNDTSSIIAASFHFYPGDEFIDWFYENYYGVFDYDYVQVKNTKLYFFLFWHEHKERTIYIDD